MKPVLFLTALCLSLSAHAGELLPIGYEIMPGSLASEAQVAQLRLLVIEEIRSNRSNEESLALINAQLAAMKLPQIGPNPSIAIISGNGFMPSTEGAALEDGKHRFCLPCETGWNRYEMGIIPVKRKPPSPPSPAEPSAPSKPGQVSQLPLLYQLAPGSLASVDQVSQLRSVIIGKAQQGDLSAESLAALNKKLSELGLPQVQAGATVEVVTGNGIVPSVEGATIRDQSHNFCLPCKTGRNRYVIGITPVKK
jgi:hypothetical protein